MENSAMDFVGLIVLIVGGGFGLWYFWPWIKARF